MKPLVVKVSPSGKLSLPERVRHVLGLTAGGEILLKIEGKQVSISSSQDIEAPHTPSKEFIAENGESAGHEPNNAFDRMRRHFCDLGGVDLELPPRTPGREPPNLD